MDAIEKRARELVAAEHEARGFKGHAKRLREGLGPDSNPDRMALNAAIAALTPPEGYVLVPVEPTEAMIEAICTEHASGGWPQGYSRYAQHLRREHAGEGYRAMLAARPEVP